MSKDQQLQSKVSKIARTDIGRRREENQDNLLVLEKEEFNLYAVADGMGGVEGGAIASKIAVDLLKSGLENEKELSPYTVLQLCARINSEIYEHGKRETTLSGMGTTLTALFIQGNELLLLNIGDSRIYRLRDAGLLQLSQDHTLVNELLQAGSITKDQLDTHPGSHMLTRSLGPLAVIEPDCWWLRSNVEPNDYYLICSDGLYNMVDEPDIVKTINSSGNLEQAVDSLIAQANDNGGSDNITVILLKVARDYVSPKKQGESQLFETDTLRFKLKEPVVPEAVVNSQSKSDNQDSKASASRLIISLALISIFILILPYIVFTKYFSNQNLKVVSNKNSETSDYQNLPTKEFKNQAAGSSTSTQSLVQRKKELDELIIRGERILSLYQSGTSEQVSERMSFLDSNSKVLYQKRGELQREIEKQAGELAKWYIYRDNKDSNTFLKLARELSDSYKEIWQARSNFEDATWRYLSELENTRNQEADEQKLTKVSQLVATREKTLAELEKIVRKVIDSEIDKINHKISTLTLKRYGIDRKLEQEHEEDRQLSKLSELNQENRELGIKKIAEELDILRREREALEQLF